MGSNIGIPADALRFDWQTIEALSVELADQIEAASSPVDAVLVLQRGGAFPGAIVAWRLGLSGDQVLSAGITSYEQGATVHGESFREGQFPSVQDVAGKHILVVDEVCDSGRTLEYVIARLTAHHAASVRSAVLHYKPDKSVTGYEPDFFVAQTDKWIVYPWEVHEQAGIGSKLSRRASSARQKASV